MRHRPAALLLILTAAVSLGCAASSVQLRPHADLEAPVAADRSRIVIVRENQGIGRNLDITVIDGRTEIGSLACGDYLSWDHAPGRRLIELHVNRPKIDGGMLETLLDHETAPGETKVYAIHINDDVKGPLSVFRPEDVTRRADFKTPLGAALWMELNDEGAATLLEESTPAPVED
ncbi:MAG: hypothetical protein AAFZ65_09090 [Planctomycetota bacterium]